MKIYEVMNNAVEWKWLHIDTEGGLASFSVYDEYKIKKWTYSVDIREEVQNVYEIEFSLEKINDKTNRGEWQGVTDTGNQFLVFGTVKEILVDFIKNHAPPEIYGIVFTAKGSSRQKLYTRFLKQTSKLGFPSTMEKASGSDVLYIMAVDDESLTEIIQGIDEN